MQLRDVQELNCLTDSDRPSGEIYVKGNAVMLGYFKNPELTKQVIDEEGWFKVGDIGIMHKSGAIEIVERMNEVKKLQNGIFITPQRLESVYASAPLVEQIMVDVNSNFNFLVAVVTLNDEKL
jgi:long-chain acyl-CoA synthetase